MKCINLSKFLFAAVAAVAMNAGTSAVAAHTDEHIASSFKETYVYKHYLKDDSVTIEVKDGVATLTGTVASESHKDLAGDTAAGLPGVTKVDNNLKVKGETLAAASDAWILSKVKMVLAFRSDVKAIGTNVDVKDGVVTITGEADNAAQKELTTEYAKDIEGVKEVNNKMTVGKAANTDEKRTAGEKLDDASITAQAKMALATHRSTSAIKTKVETKDGAVTVSGPAKNDAEKALVTKLVKDIRGVTSVTNNMTVEEK